MVYETSYEGGRKPFVPDLSRGYWSTPGDFVYASLGLVFKLDVCLISWFYVFRVGVFAIVPYLICLGLYVVPLMVIQSFMGQFASSGFISVFRISPLFKGMGYISLVLNCAVLIYYSLFAAVPLLFLFHSFRPTLPWSCEGYEYWAHNFTESEKINICNMTEKVITNDTDDTNSTYLNYHIPSVLFFKSHYSDVSLTERERTELSISWEIVVCTFIIWTIIAGVLYKFFNTAKFGKTLRYCIWTTMILLLICLIRFLFLPGATKGMSELLKLTPYDIQYGLISVPIYAMSALGAGWGSLITLSSFNHFKADIMRYSWIIAIGQMGIFMAFGLVSNLIESHFEVITADQYSSYIENHWVVFVSTASAIASMELPNMWSILYYTMLTLAAFVVMITQVFSILVSIFDEFEQARSRKTLVTFSLIATLALCSLYFCTNHGAVHFTALSIDSIFNQTVLNLLLLLVVLWVYGRERFQRDIEFMLGKPFPTWKVYMLRFVSPLCLLFTLLLATVFAIMQHYMASLGVLIIACFLIILPWLFIPGYSIAAMLQTTGSCLMRFKRCSRPTDWYPLELEDRQHYEEAMGNVDITHQLQEVRDEAS